MKVVILTGGTNGDVRPLVALGKGLKKAGHEVNIIAYDMYENFIREHELGFVTFQFDIVKGMQSDAGKAIMLCGDNAWCSFEKWSKVMVPGMHQMCDSAWAASEDADLIICSSLGGHFGPPIAKARGIPYLTAFFQPHFPTGEFAHFFAPEIFFRRNFGRWINRLTHTFSTYILWYPYRKTLDEWCQKRLGKKWVTLQGYAQQLHPSLCPFSSIVIPKPKDWEADLTLTGYWFLDEAETWQPPAELLAFLNAGTPPITIGFGSMGATQEMVDTAVEALQRTQQRGILLQGWSNLDVSNLPDTVFAANEIPHDWLLPKSAAVVHHGGAGSTGAGLRSGVPSIVVPFAFDQYFWAQRVFTLGAGPQYVPRKRFTVDNLAVAINEAVNNQTIRQKAAEIGARIRAEDGIARAVEEINKRHP